MLKILLIVLVVIIMFITGLLIGSVVTAIGIGEELKEHENYGNGWGGLKWLKLSNQEQRKKLNARNAVHSWVMMKKRMFRQVKEESFRITIFISFVHNVNMKSFWTLHVKERTNDERIIRNVTYHCAIKRSCSHYLKDSLWSS